MIILGDISLFWSETLTFVCPHFHCWLWSTLDTKVLFSYIFYCPYFIALQRFFSTGLMGEVGAQIIKWVTSRHCTSIQSWFWTWYCTLRGHMLGAGPLDPQKCGVQLDWLGPTWKTGQWPQFTLCVNPTIADLPWICFARELDLGGDCFEWWAVHYICFPCLLMWNNWQMKCERIISCFTPVSQFYLVPFPHDWGRLVSYESFA